MYTAPNQKAALPQQGLLNLPPHVRVGTACHAYFPHHRQHITGRGTQLPRTRPGGRHILSAPERDPSVAEQAAAHILSGEWQQQLATAVPEVQKRAAIQAQAASLMLAGAAYHAHAMWQYVQAHWPAWQASLQEDVEILLEYAYGLIPAWFAVLHATVLRAFQDAAALEPVQLVLARCAAAATAAEASAAAATEAVQGSVQRLAELVKLPTLSGEAGAQASGKQSDQDDHHKVKRGSGLEAARVAYSITWFGWFGAPSSAQQLHQPFQQLAQQMSLHDWQQLQQLQDEAVYQRVQTRRWRKPQRRDWIDRVVSRAAQVNSSSSSKPQVQKGPSRDHMWRPRHEDSIWAAPVRQVAGALQSAQHSLQQGTQGCVEAVQATGRAAVGGVQGGVQRATTVLVAPVHAARAAVQRLEPPPAGVVAAGVVLLAGAIASTVLRRQEEAQQLAVQQRVVLKQRAEELKAQKARIMGVLSVEVPNGGSSSRRKGAAPPARASIPVTVAAPADAAELGAEDVSGPAAAAPGSVGGLRAMEMDPEAAAMWKKFLAGSRAMDVPMWDNRMVEDLPKVSRKDIDRQTQKIRSAAAPEEQAALEAADMEQLARQLQQLDHAPIGRKARAAWLQEKQQRQQQGQGWQDSSSPSRASSRSPAGKADGQEEEGNPFAISPEIRSKWDDLEADGTPAAPASASRKPVSRPLPSSSSSRPGSRSGSRSGQRSSPAAASDNPFAIPAAARQQWEAEDHMFSDQGKPILGPLGGILATFTSGKVKPQEAQQQQHQQRRRQAIRAEEVEAAAILRLQQQVEQQEEQQRALRGGSKLGDQGALGRKPEPDSSSLLPRQQQQPAQAVQKQQQPPAAAATGAAAATPAGFDGLKEGSPEWAEKMRQVMLQSGAARRARMQQMRGQAGGAAQQSTAAAVPQPAIGGQGQTGRAAARAEAGSGSLSAAVSASDAQSVTAAIPSKAAVRGVSAEEPAAAAKEPLDAESKEKVNQGNPFSV